MAEAETLTPEQIRLETLALGFRTHQRASVSPLSGSTRMETPKSLNSPKPAWSGLDHGRVMATLDGLVVADRLPLEFAD